MKNSGLYQSKLRRTAFGFGLAVSACLALLSLGGCGDDLTPTSTYPEKGPDKVTPNPTGKKVESLLGPDGLSLFGKGSKKGSDGEGGGGIGVNSFLWRASLDTIGFMPLASADPFGGVIITDWYSPPQSQAERFKITVYILDRVLRADGVKVSVFRQTRQGDGWVDDQVANDTVVNLENAILTRARQLRVDSAGL